ncbi:MAG: hypothetical protein ACRC44_03765 [Bifidobacterium asteroides]
MPDTQDNMTLAEWLIKVTGANPDLLGPFHPEASLPSSQGNADSEISHSGGEPEQALQGPGETQRPENIEEAQESINLRGTNSPMDGEAIAMVSDVSSAVGAGASILCGNHSVPDLAPNRETLPTQRVLEIASQLSPLDLSDLSQTSRRLRGVILETEDSGLKQKLEKYQSVQKTWTALLRMRPAGTDENYMLLDKNVIKLLVRNLDCIMADQQKALFEAAEQLRTPWNRAEALGSFGPGLSATTPEFRQIVVNTILNKKSVPGPRATAIAGLGPGLAVVPERQDELVDAAVGFDLEEHCAEAIAGMGAGAAVLTERNRDRIFEKAANLLDELSRGVALGGFGPSLAALKPKQLQTLIDKLCAMDDRSLAAAVDGIGPHMSVPPLTSTQVMEVIAAVYRMTDEVCRGKAIGGLCKGAQLRTPDDRKDLLNAATERVDPATGDERGENYRADTIGGFGPSLGALLREEQELLVANAEELTLPNMRAKVVAGLGRGAAALDRLLQERVVNIAISIGDPEQKIVAFAGFGDGENLTTMEPELRQLLMTNASNEEDDDTRAVLIASLAA